MFYNSRFVFPTPEEVSLLARLEDDDGFEYLPVSEIGDIPTISKVNDENGGSYVIPMGIAQDGDYPGVIPVHALRCPNCHQKMSAYARCKDEYEKPDKVYYLCRSCGEANIQDYSDVREENGVARMIETIKTIVQNKGTSMH